MLKDLVVEDKKGVVRGSEREKNICNSISYGTEEVTATTINMGSQTDMISSGGRKQPPEVFCKKRCFSQEKTCARVSFLIKSQA